MAELPGREEVGDPLVDLPDGDVEAGGDDTALVDAAGQVDDDLVATVVVDDLELTNVPWERGGGGGGVGLGCVWGGVGGGRG